MALLFICDNCQEKYPAKAGIHAISYQDDNANYKVERDSDPCYKCEKVAEEARLEALQKRKKS